ncbi:MAG: hypothetical protein AAGJ18_21115, partial [Bacteroidota bacterium]
MAQPLLKPLGNFQLSKNLKPLNLGSILLLALGLLLVSFTNFGKDNSYFVKEVEKANKLLLASNLADRQDRLLDISETEKNSSLDLTAPCEPLVLSVGTKPESACGERDGMILIRYQDSNEEESLYTVKIGYEDDHEMVIEEQNGNPIIIPNLPSAAYHNIRLIRELDGCISKSLDKMVFVKTECERPVASARMGDELVVNGCNSNRSFDAYIIGVKGVTNPCFTIPNPENVTKVIVELWVEDNNPSPSVTFFASGGTSGNSSQNTTGIPVTQSPFSGQGETIFRETFDGNFAEICTSYDDGNSLAIYVERAVTGGASSIFTSDRELDGQPASVDDCLTINATIAPSDLSRDMGFRVPIHEKGSDNTRNVVITINLKNSGGTTITSQMQTFFTQNAGAEASLFALNFENVSSAVEMAEIIVCSPAGTGESFGVGAITTSTIDCLTGSACEGLFQNPSFESGNTNNWQTTPNTNTSVSTDYLAQGDFVAIIAKDDPVGIDAMIFQEVGASELNTYRFNFFAGTDNPAGNHEVQLEFYNNSTLLSTVSQQIDFDVNFGDLLQAYVIEGYAPENTNRVRFKGTSSEDRLFLDDICGVVIPYVAPWNFTCADDKEVMIMGEGLLDTWNDNSRTISFDDTDVYRVIAEANFRDANGSCRPETVRFTGSDSSIRTVSGLSIPGPASNNSATFRAEFYGTLSSITLSDVENNCTPISFVLYIFKENTGAGRGANGQFI